MLSVKSCILHGAGKLQLCFIMAEGLSGCVTDCTCAAFGVSATADQAGSSRIPGSLRTRQAAPEFLDPFEPDGYRVLDRTGVQRLTLTVVRIGFEELCIRKPTRFQIWIEDDFLKAVQRSARMLGSRASLGEGELLLRL